ncbi:hypothetical protein Pint_34572 [Pistacia integerrima]|uniref:Uncharacterized protein n=1 Tax=Pistacia integerrima TaxID=434235 RepID=A0ACC0X7B7_9ROSI|nr:hypothetical protein Pint_34572 [Pistacia integerrima]
MGPYGENLAEGYGNLNGMDAVKMWVSEKPNYDYASNSCVGDECLHYTQVVWRKSTQLGCGRVKCQNGWCPRLPLLCTKLPTDYVQCPQFARAAVGVGPVTWDNTVAAFAQNYANQRIGDCALVHSGGGGKYGENLAWSSADLSGTDAVKMWVDEKADYDYNSNTCAAGKVCGHYTQVVWRDSVRIGCAKVRCNNGGTFYSACNNG